MMVRRDLALQIGRVSIFLFVLVTVSVGAVVSTRARQASTGLPLQRFQSSLFSGAGNCASCHLSDGFVLTTSEGEDVSMPQDWRSTMMANAFHDPYFQAVIEREVALRPGLKGLIEDECLTCHAPVGRTQAHYDGATEYSLETARQSALAKEGVSCTVCHQIQPDNLGTHASYSGHYIINGSRTIFGPYADVDPFTMQSSVGYTPVFGAHKQQSELCATCHTLFTPILNEQNEIIGEFPEQTPYLEWKNSEYASIGKLQSCQDCHMPKTNEPIIITNFPPGDPRTPFWRHHFVGGNAFMLTMLQNNIDTLGLRASTAQFQTTIDRTLKQLRERTAVLEITNAEVVGGDAQVTVRVTNLAGHKLPTAYPTRRAWLHFTARDRSGTVLFESGAWDERDEIVGIVPGMEPHHDLITSGTQVQIYESVLGDKDSSPTISLLSAVQYLKDNRIPPKGFLSTGPDIQHTSIIGEAADDPNFNRDGATEGTGTDIVTYRFPLTVAVEEISFEVRMVFQTIQPRHVDVFRDSPTPAGAAFLEMYDAMDNDPVPVASAFAKLVSDEDQWVIY